MAGTGWVHHLDGSRPVHVWPDGDLVEHETDTDEADCVCGPQVIPVGRRDGSVGWVYRHHPLDGRI